MEISHKSHEHPLVFTDGESEDNQDEPVDCWGCMDLICGPRFSCFTCQFHLHKSCAEAPDRFQDHPLHPQHTLDFKIKSISIRVSRYPCNACGEKSRFVYQCSTCSFELDITCALSNEKEDNIIFKSSGKDCFRYGMSQHDLLLEEDQSASPETDTVNCCGCLESISAPFFFCSRSRCQFRIHKSCANLPKRINVSFLPQEQSLSLVPKSYRSCRICGQEGISFYVCLEHDLFIHPKCALDHRDTMKIVREKHIQHRSHHHNLTLLEDEKEWASIENDHPSCELCMRQLDSSPRYSCELCPFILHKSCAELPGQIESHLHPKHPLVLFAQPRSRRITCCFCDVEVRDLNFCCLQCGLILHVDCFFSLHNCKRRRYDHPHSFVDIKTFKNLACDACGEEGYFSIWQCTDCHLMVHKKCAELSRLLRVGGHNHDLKLTYFLRFVNKCDQFLKCPICCREVNVDYATYCCFSCNYVAHLNCAREIGNVVSVGESSLEGSHDSAANPVSIITLLGDGNTHKHEFTLKEQDPEDHKYCEGCVTLISSPFYRCKDCDFYLHKQCAEMPETKTLPFHPHPLHFNQVEEFRWCNKCNKIYNGFVYSCKVQDFLLTIDFHCVKLMEGLRHPCHVHQLSFPDPRVRTDERCRGCGQHSYLNLVCSVSECEYVLGFCCAKLPNRITQRYDDHLLSLSSKDKDDFEEYYCDICENKRDPNVWFYCCKKCEFFAHIKCALVSRPYIKFGTKWKSGFHEHPLTFVEQSTKKPIPICHRCGYHCYSKVLECSQCSFGVHLTKSCFDDLYSLLSCNK